MAKLLPSSEVKGAPTPEERPTMKQLLEVMRLNDIDIATRWRDLGLELVDSNRVLRVIEADHPSDVDTCCRLMFEKWLDMTPDASWSQIVAALNRIKMNTAADAVSKLLKSDSANTSDVTIAITFSDCGDNISMAFTLLTRKIFQQLKRADFNALKIAVLQQSNGPKGVQFPDKLTENIISAQNLGVLFNVLVIFKYWNWADLRLLEALVISSDIHAAKVIIDQYKKIYFPMKLSELLDKLHITPHQKEHRNAYTAKVASKIDKEPGDVTVGDLSHNCSKLETVIMDINNGSCVLENLGTGCLEIHWLIPTHCRFHAYKSALNNCHKFCDMHLQYLQIEPYPPIYDPFTIQPTMLSTLLRLPKPIASTPAEVIGHYYCLLLDNLDNSVVSKIMLKLKLVNEEDLINCAKLHSEYQKNAFLLDQLLVTNNNSSNIFEFCRLLYNESDQQEIGYMLVNAIESIPADDMDSASDAQSSSTPSQPTSSEEDDTDISPVYQPEVFCAAKTVHIRFLNIVAQLKQELNNYNSESFLETFTKLTASTSHYEAIPLIPSEHLSDLDNAGTKNCLSRLSFLWTWSNHSILNALVEACNCQDGIKMLSDFESQIDATQPMELFPIPPPSMKMAPSSSSPFTVLSIRGEYDRDEPVPLQYVNDVATIMTEKFGISSHALQLLAARANPLMLYWMIPKSVVPLIGRGINNHFEENGFSEIVVYPSTILFATDNLSHGSYALLGVQPQKLFTKQDDHLKDKESVEYKAFNRFYNELITVLYDKSYLTHFIASGTISVHDVHHISDLPENDRAMHLLKYISAPLEYSEKQSFYKMLEIMKTHGNLYAMELAENIETFISEVDSATLHYTEGPSNTTNNVVSSSDIDFSDYDDIPSAFSLLIAEITKLLKKADFFVLKRAIILQRNAPRGVQLPDDLYQSIKTAQDLDTLLDLLADSQYLSWVDLRLLEVLTMSSGIRETKVLVNKYKDVIFSKKLSEVLDKMFTPQQKKKKEDFQYTCRVAIKLDKNPKEVTVGDLSEYAFILEAVIMDINNGSCSDLLGN